MVTTGDVRAALTHENVVFLLQYVASLTQELRAVHGRAGRAGHRPYPAHDATPDALARQDGVRFHKRKGYLAYLVVVVARGCGLSLLDLVADQAALANLG